MTCLFASSAFAQGTPCTVGGSIDVLWNGDWYAATIEAGPNGMGQCYIGYDGWGNEWDEWVGADRMRPRGGAAAVAAPAAPAAAAPTAPPAAAAPAAPPAAPNPCPMGGSVSVLWNGDWYNATIEAGPNAMGQCYIGYDGWGDEWDEWVGSDRMRAR